MGYKITAYIQNKKSSMSPEEVALVSFGFKKNEAEMFEFKPSKEILSAMEEWRGKYRGLRRTSASSKKPLTLSWFPLSDKTYLFKDLHGKPLKIRLEIEDTENKSNKWQFVFDDVVLSPKVVEEKVIAGTRRMDLRMNGLFVKFVDDGE